MAIVNKPDMNYGVWAENGNIEIPSSEKVDEGWVIEKPLNEHMNWLQNRADKMLQYLNQRGMPEWDFRTEYPIYAFVIRSGVMYQSLSQNKDKDPSENTNVWKKPFAETGVADGAAGEINKIKNTDGYLTHYVRKKAPVLDAMALGVSYYEKTGKSGLNFTGIVPSIFNNGKPVAEFSGGTTGKDVVTHEQLSLRLQGYLVGDIYITTSNQDPKVRFGYGTWERFSEGRVLVGVSSSVSNDIPQWVKTVGSTSGDYVHKLTEAEMPSHVHQMKASNMKIAHDSSREDDVTLSPSGDLVEGLSSSTGGDQPHNNVQPSLVVYMWKRTA